MKCGICNSEDPNIWIDKRDGSWCPCYRCSVIIGDTAMLGSDRDELDDLYVIDEDLV